MSTLLLFCIFLIHRTLPDAADSRLAEEWRVSRIPFAQADLELEASALRMLGCNVHQHTVLSGDLDVLE